MSDLPILWEQLYKSKPALSSPIPIIYMYTSTPSPQREMNTRRTTFKKKSDKPDKDEKAAKTLYGVTVLLNNIAEASSKAIGLSPRKTRPD